MTRRYSHKAEDWLRDNYGHGDINDTLDMFEAEFGWRPTRQALYQKAFMLGLVKRRRSHERGKTVERTVRWSDPRDAEFLEWMLENDRGHSIAKVVDDFEEAFGFRLTRGQVSQFRARHGVGTRRGYGGRRSVPIGTERDTGKGYTLVKVAERATVPLSKDNWRMRHHLVWEQEHGMPVPDGCEIVHADHDASNDSPGNLVAVDKKLVGIINAHGLEYWDAESLEAAVLRAKLMSGIRERESGGVRTCEVCGAEFEPTPVQARYRNPVRTCPACLASGKKARGKPKRAYRRVCEVCHAEYDATRKDQRRCPSCIARAPKHSPIQQIRKERA